MPEIKVTLIKSTIGAQPRQKKIVQALGLNKLNSSKVHKDNEAIQGMVKLVYHLVKVEKLSE